LKKSFDCIESEWRKYHCLHPNASLFTWLQEQDRLAKQSSLPLRPPTPPYSTSLDYPGPWSTAREVPSHAWYDRRLPDTSCSSSAPQDPHASQRPQVLPLPALPATPKSIAPKVAFKKKEIASWPTVDWTFLQTSASIFTNEWLDGAYIRVAIQLDIDEQTDWVKPGRLGWLAGCTDDRLVAYVRFDGSSERHAVPFINLSNGPPVKSMNAVAVIRDCARQPLVGRIGFFLKWGKRLGLSSTQENKQWSDLIEDNLPQDFATTTNTLVLYKKPSSG
jgi:hypothetical protein